MLLLISFFEAGIMDYMVYRWSIWWVIFTAKPHCGCVEFSFHIFCFILVFYNCFLVPGSTYQFWLFYGKLIFICSKQGIVCYRSVQNRMKFINGPALSKIRRAASKCHSVLTRRCTFRRRAKVAVDSVDRRSLAGKLFQISGPETEKFLRPVTVTVHCTSSLLEVDNLRCRRPVRWTTGLQISVRYGGSRPRRHLLTSIAILYCIRWALYVHFWCLHYNKGILWIRSQLAWTKHWIE